jgi:hypothetical protein
MAFTAHCTAPQAHLTDNAATNQRAREQLWVAGTVRRGSSGTYRAAWTITFSSRLVYAPIRTEFKSPRTTVPYHSDARSLMVTSPICSTHRAPE